MTIPTNGLVFYAPLAENADCAYTLTNSGSVTFQTFGGRQCAYFDGSSALYNNSFQVADAFTFSFHAYFQSGDCLFALGPWTNSHNMEVMTNNGYPRLYTYKNGSDENLIDATTNIKDGWHHIACTYDGTTQKLYVDGNLSASRTFSATIGAGIALGTNFTSSGSIGRDTKMTGYLAACRVYNRALSDSEITELSKEFSTTGGSLDTVLSALDGARDALVTAINAKGGSLAQDSTLYQCANAVNEISTGTDTSDATATASDILQDKTAYAKDEKITGTIPTVTASMSDNVVTVPKGYVKSAQTLTVGTALNAFTITPAANAQVISKGSYLKGEVTVAGDTNLTAANIKSGVTIFNVAGTYEGESTGGTSAEYYKCASVDTSAKTWSGYKAVQQENGGYTFEETVTTGLTYTSVTPVVGGIYSADALVIVSLLYTGTPTLTSPTGMTSESSDEWEISASSFYSTNSAPWKAFDGVTGSSSGWTGASNSSWWLQWQNKTKPVLVQKLRFQGTASGDIAQQAITSFILQGSDDGSTWTDLYTASGLTWTTGYEWKEFTFSNSKSYYYHRLADITVAANYPTIVELETYDM